MTPILFEQKTRVDDDLGRPQKNTEVNEELTWLRSTYLQDKRRRKELEAQEKVANKQMTGWENIKLILKYD